MLAQVMLRLVALALSAIVTGVAAFKITAPAFETGEVVLPAIMVPVNMLYVESRVTSLPSPAAINVVPATTIFSLVEASPVISRFLYCFPSV